MTTDADILRRQIVDLFHKRKDGSIADRDFQKKSTEQTVALYRSVIETTLDEGETIERQHHIIEAHTALNRSILREPEQRAVSLYLTNKRLMRLRSTVYADRPPSCDASDNTVIDEIALQDITATKTRREFREGELIAGLVIALVALVFESWLLVTSKFMLGLGLLGAFHAVAFPNRILELVLRTPSDNEPFAVCKLGTKSGKKMRAAIEERIRERTAQ